MAIFGLSKIMTGRDEGGTPPALPPNTRFHSVCQFRGFRSLRWPLSDDRRRLKCSSAKLLAKCSITSYILTTSVSMNSVFLVVSHVTPMESDLLYMGKSENARNL